MFKRACRGLIALLFVTVSNVDAVTPVIEHTNFNGLSIRYVQVPGSKYFSQIWTVNAGLMTMPCELASLPHLVEHLIADRNPVVKTWRGATGLELFSSAFTRLAVTEYESTFHVSHWEDGFSQSSKLILAPPVFNIETVLEAKKDVANEYSLKGAGIQSSGYIAAASLSGGRLNVCDLKSTGDLNEGVIEGFVETTYAASNMTLNLSGPARWEHVRSKIEPVLAGYLEGVSDSTTPESDSFPYEGTVFNTKTGIAISIDWASHVEAEILYRALYKKINDHFRHQAQLVYGVEMQLFSDRRAYYIVFPGLPSPLTENDILSIADTLNAQDIIAGMLHHQLNEVSFDNTPNGWTGRLSFLRDSDIPMETEWERVDPEELAARGVESIRNAVFVKGRVPFVLKAKEWIDEIIVFLILLLLMGYFCKRQSKTSIKGRL